ncbi:MAG TPA: hypothetical protein H9760_03355 [Candidatus Alistipes stercoravium]|nr:hypothetical protein [Candidatus Alistipes stercoravium]
MRIFLSLTAAAALFAACGESLDPEGSPAASQRLFRFDTAPFPGDETPGAGDSGLSGVIRAYRFERGQLAEQFGPLTAAGSAAELRLARTGGTLYVVAGPDALLPEVAPGFPEAEWLDLTAASATGLAEPFATGRLDLGELEPGTAEVPLTLTRGVARLDLHLRVAGTATVERITLRGVAGEGYLFPSEAPRTPADASRSDAVCVGDAALTTDTPAIAYLYEQTGADLGVSVEAVIDGVRHTLEGVLPRDIGRNRIYSLTLRKGIVDTEARLTVEAWGDGGESALQPDLETRLTVDAERSELPSGVRIEVGGTGLVLPHAEREVLLAVRSDVQLELEPVSAPLLEIAAEPATAGDFGSVNRFRIRKGFYTPDMAPEEVELRFRRKGLAMTYPEDRLTLRLEANPIRLEGDLTFADGNTVCDFGRYVDNELGRLTLPDERELSVEFDAGEDHWLKVEPAEEGSRVWRVVGGWRPNDPTADGRQQSARLVIRSAATGECEVYTVVRRNWGLPVTWFHGVWWCKYNARGRSRNFEDQILVPQDPAAAAGQSVQNYLMSCSPEEFRALWGWAYQGDSGVGMQVVDLEGVPSMEGFTTGSKTHINKLPADALAPDGYELPSMEEFNRVFDATDYVWVMWSGSHKLRNPWEGHADVRRTQTRRNGIAVGSLELNDLLVLAFSSPDFPGYEALTWYGPGAQWNQAGIVHSNHCNNMLFAVHSPAGSGWYITGGMANLYLTQNGAGNNDTRIVRFKKSPVEYIY